jgi:hypothetical protein
MASVFALRALTEDYDSCYGNVIEHTIGLAAAVGDIVDFLAKKRVEDQVFSDEENEYPDNPLILSRGYVIEEVLLGNFSDDYVLRTFNWRGEEVTAPEELVVTK